MLSRSFSERRTDEYLDNRPEGFPETGPLSTEWISGVLLAFQLTGPAPLPGLSLIAGMRFAADLLD